MTLFSVNLHCYFVPVILILVILFLDILILDILIINSGHINSGLINSSHINLIDSCHIYSSYVLCKLCHPQEDKISIAADVFPDLAFQEQATFQKTSFAADDFPDLAF